MTILDMLNRRAPVMRLERVERGQSDAELVATFSRPVSPEELRFLAEQLDRATRMGWLGLEAPPTVEEPQP